jgi:predicted nucleic acid-binding protein
MSAAFILDCSLAMTWLFEDEATAETTKLLDRVETETALVPAFWYLEVANVIAVAERRKRVTLVKSGDFLSQLSKLDLEVELESTERAFDQLLSLCRTHGLTSYDAVYLDLAARRRLPLATLDEPLRKAAKKLGIKLLGK